MKARKKRIYRLSDDTYQKVKNSFKAVERFLDDALETGFHSIKDKLGMDSESVKLLTMKTGELIRLFILNPTDWEKAMVLNEEIASIYISLNFQPEYQRSLTESFSKSMERIFDLDKDELIAWEYTYEFLFHGIFEIVKRYYEDRELRKQD